MVQHKAQLKKQQKRGVDFKVSLTLQFIHGGIWKMPDGLTVFIAIALWNPAENKAKDWKEIAATEEYYEYWSQIER